MSVEEKRKFVYELYSSGIKYKILAYVFDTTTEIVINHFKSLGIKYCSDCEKILPRNSFSVSSTEPDGLQWRCKSCRKKYNERNHDKIKTYNGKHYQKNSEELKAYQVWYRQTFPEKRSEYNKKWFMKKYNSDSKFKLDSTFGHQIWDALKNNKSGITWKFFVPYTLDELMEHLESQFDENMTWDNYGSYWHVDHIKPKISFNYVDHDNEEFRECWALENLQPLPAHINSKKQHKIGPEWGNE